MQSFPKVRLIAVGKVKKRWIQDGVATYAKRVPELDIVEIKDSTPAGEAAKILAITKSGDRLIVLTEEGRSYSSTQLAALVGGADSGSLVFVIGGPEGIDGSLKQAATGLLSLSAMTFPHELARLLLIEQLYRAKTILQNGSYHK
ncbi:MAG: 23S rRNA (pseudouridine(1915)-N(3))-methyltransferase RlmH [Elainellaceae cyanobacterium]